ncbi:monoacylglycerol lipase ABHD12-like isoform X1 [Biomphalaria glabrata]
MSLVLEEKQYENHFKFNSSTNAEDTIDLTNLNWLETLDFLYIHLEYLHDHTPFVWLCAKITFITLFFIYVAIPVFVKANQWIMPRIIFLNIVRWPPFTDLTKPHDFGLNNTRNFYLNTQEGVKIGVWHVLPVSVQSDSNNIPWDKFEDELSNGKMVFLYLHGNSGTRGSYHRVQLYKILAQLDFHVIAIDYRGYGDSTGHPTENGVVFDSYTIYKWLKSRVGDSKIFLWGHSLGTGVTAKLAKLLCEEEDHPAGIVLEAPFNNIRDAAFHHPFSAPYRSLPYFEYVFVDPLKEHGLFFNSEENLASVIPHIMILHAEDDLIVPFHLGEKLYAKAKESRGHDKVQFVSFEASLGYGHKLIYKAPQLPSLIREFVAKSNLRLRNTSYRY